MMRQFLKYIHFLRGIAILYVVAVHARGYQSYWLSSPDTYRFLDSFSDPSEGNGTTLFLFIGGFLFQHLNSKNFIFTQYLKQKFKNLIMPYLVISIPLILVRLTTDFQSASLPDGFHDRSPIYQTFHYLLTGAHLAPFWFISTIILFYFSAPILHALDNHFFYRYIFPLIILASLFTYRPEHNANPFYSYLHFIPVYMLGMCVSFYKEKILSDDIIPVYILFFIYLGLCFAELSGWITLPRHVSFEYVLRERVLIFNVYLLKTYILCFLLLLFFYRLREREFTMLQLLGAYSFGLFFVHYFFISISRKLFSWLTIPVDFSMLSYIIYFLLILMISTATVYIIKKITGRYSRYLIGS